MSGNDQGDGTGAPWTGRPFLWALPPMLLAAGAVAWFERGRDGGDPASPPPAATTVTGESPSATVSGTVRLRGGKAAAAGALVLLVDGPGYRVLDASLADGEGRFSFPRPHAEQPASLWILTPDGDAVHRNEFPATAAFRRPLTPAERAPLTVMFRTEGLMNRRWEVKESAVRLALPALPPPLASVAASSPRLGVLMVPGDVPLDVQLRVEDGDRWIQLRHQMVGADGFLLDDILPVPGAREPWSATPSRGDRGRVLVFAPAAGEDAGVSLQAAGEEEPRRAAARGGLALFEGVPPGGVRVSLVTGAAKGEGTATGGWIDLVTLR